MTCIDAFFYCCDIDLILPIIKAYTHILYTIANIITIMNSWTQCFHIGVQITRVAINTVLPRTVNRSNRSFYTALTSLFTINICIIWHGMVWLVFGVQKLSFNKSILLQFECNGSMQRFYATFYDLVKNTDLHIYGPMHNHTKLKWGKHLRSISKWNKRKKKMNNPNVKPNAFLKWANKMKIHYKIGKCGGLILRNSIESSSPSRTLFNINALQSFFKLQNHHINWNLFNLKWPKNEKKIFEINPFSYL